jgi:hypothetical protein
VQRTEKVQGMNHSAYSAFLAHAGGVEGSRDTSIRPCIEDFGEVI